MRKPSICGDISIIEMTTTNHHQDTAGESRIERMRKFLSSPLTKKKPSVSQSKIFGIPLEVLIQRSPTEAPIPFIITRICQYIERCGLMHEGLFRISGNARLIDRLKSSFDQSGDAPLESEGDVTSAAGLLKLFLRELPDPIIPLSMHQQFLNAVKGNDREECVRHLKELVEKLPDTNFNVLKYLSHFLLQVSEFEEQNRMSPFSLGIVFGPNLFRVTEDFVGLKDQSLTNQIVTYFITDYYAIFQDNIQKCFVKDKSFVSIPNSRVKHDMSYVRPPVSMVSSWPKPTPFPSVMPALSLQPLSVSIPVMDDALFLLDSNHPRADAGDGHVLMVNNLMEKALHQSTSEQLFGEEEKEETGGVIMASKRKRKDRKESREDFQTTHSHSEEEAAHSAEELVFYHSESQIHPVNHIEVPLISPRRNEEYIHCVTEKEQIKHLKPFEVDPRCSVKAVNTNGNTDLSPHPPKPKRREIENSSSEPLLDPQRQHRASFTNIDLDYHEIQRNAERIASFQRIPPQRNYTISPKPVSHASITSETDVLEEPEVSKMDSERQDSSEGAEFTYNKGYFDNISVRVNVDTDSMKENREVIITHAEIHESSLTQDKGPKEEKLDDHKHYQRGHRHHRHHYRRHHPQEESARLSHPLHELHPTQKNEVDRGKQRELDDDEYTSNTKDSIPPSNLPLVHDTSNVNDSINPEYRFSWPMIRGLQDEDDTALSPLPQHLRKTGSLEAPLSPSAYRSYLSHRCLHLDPNLPPSPPVEQEDLAIGNMKDDMNSDNIKQLSRKIHSLKKKLKHFEVNFEVAHGFRPSHAEKMKHTEVKVLMSELNKAKRELKQLREEPHVSDTVVVLQWSPVEDGSSSSPDVSSKGTSTDQQDEIELPGKNEEVKVTVEQTLNSCLKILSEKRKTAERPEALEEMTKDQVIEEKLAIQKVLLKFESIHGRPSSKSDRDLMRPLYDRYRSVKRIVARSSAFSNVSSKVKDAMELQPILEHVAMDFTSPDNRRMPEPPITETTEEQEELSERNIAETDFKVEVYADQIEEEEAQISLEESLHLDSQITSLNHHSNFHELHLPELLEQQKQTRTEKHRVRKILRNFEDQFQKENGRKVQKEDRMPMETVYAEYKTLACFWRDVGSFPIYQRNIFPQYIHWFINAKKAAAYKSQIETFGGSGYKT